jgi:hypothetical protein
MSVLLLILALVLAPAALLAHDATPAASPPAVPEADALIADVRRATARYLDIAHARGDGFVQVSGMEPRHGYHFVKRDVRALAATTLDLANPPILLYVERDGAWQLVGVEYALARRPASGPLPPGAWAEHEASCHYRDWRELPAARAGACPPRHPESGAPLVHWHPAFAVAHVWAWYPNPDGPFAPQNRYLDAWGGGAARAAGHHHERNAVEIAYSEMNHRVSGGFLLGLAVLGALTADGRRAAVVRWLAAAGWIAFGAYIFVTADPEAWPLGAGRFAGVFRDALVLQHKLLSLIPVAIGLAEAARAVGRAMPLRWIVPGVAIAGGLALFVHDHEGGLHFDRTFVQHAAMGLAGLVGGATLLVVGRAERWAARLRWVWPALLGVVAVVLLVYAE